MDKDDIIRMAREAGIVVTGEAVWKLCELVAAAERERLATKFMEIHNAQQHRNNYFAFAARVIREEV